MQRVERTVSVVLPVGYMNAKGSQHRSVIGTTEVAMRFLDAADAPVVIEGFAQEGGEKVALRYRAYEGRLWEAVHDEILKREVVSDELLLKSDCSADRWQELLATDRKGLVVDHPFMPRAFKAARYMRFFEPVPVFHSGGEGIAFETAAAEVASNATKVLVAGDEILRPSFGPLLGVDWYSGRDRVRLMPLSERLRPGSGTHYAFSMLDAENVVAATGAAGMGLHGFEPVVLSEDGWDRQRIVDACVARAIEREAWSMLAPHSTARTVRSGAGFVQAYEELRSSIERNWDLDLSRIGKEWHLVAEDHLREDLSSATELLGPIAAFAQALRKRQPMNRSLDGWEALPRLVEAMSAPDFDADALSKAFG